MGITILEFKVAMETYGAKRLSDCSGSRYSVSVPCFNVAGTKFFHSGSYYIVHREKDVPEEIMNRAMAELGEKHPGGANFWWGEVHSIKGMLTLAAMLEGNYNKERIDKLTNETYKKLIDCTSIKSNVEFPFHSTHLLKMEKLYKVLAKYSNIVNPFGNSELKIKDPIQYLDTVEVTLDMQKGIEPYTRLNLSTGSYQAEFVYDENSWFYKTVVLIQRNRNNGEIKIKHYYSKENDEHSFDEIVLLKYKAIKDSYNAHPDDIDLRISLKTGKAWQAYKKEQAKLATNEQIDIMITHLKISIKKIKDKIVRKMV